MAGVEPIVAASPMPLAPSGLRASASSVWCVSNCGKSAPAARRSPSSEPVSNSPLVVVDDLLPERLADALRQAAVDLAVDQHRADDVAAVVDRDVAQQLRPRRSPGRPRPPRRARRRGRSRRPGLKKSVASRPGSISSGRLAAVGACRRSPPGSSRRSGTPLTRNLPSATSMSSAAASSLWAAIRLALSLILSSDIDQRRAADGEAAAAHRAVALRGVAGVAVVDDDLRRSRRRCSSATIWAKVVSWPWPCGEMPVKTVTSPLGSTRTVALSNGPKPQIST